MIPRFFLVVKRSAKFLIRALRCLFLCLSAIPTNELSGAKAISSKNINKGIAAITIPIQRKNKVFMNIYHKNE